MSTSNPITATLIPGDGIGPETVASTMQILDALGSPFRWDVQQAGIAGVDVLGDPFTRTNFGEHPQALLSPQGSTDYACGWWFSVIQCSLA